ncbi:hypothetical protein M3697_10830 [Janibacter melonis]|uniref:hypothetical protein n=1 Tax=Janibacter melonis TaxID=262209 RepID=UPI002042C59C|nr:hypothetical protein [Janibacter melonis]MCM3555597.1 hypothetical protein [Janibacter melonis]
MQEDETTMQPSPALARHGHVFPAIGVRGQECRSAAEVITAYRPSRSRVDDSEWAAIGPMVRRVVSAVGYDSPATALLAMRSATGFAMWALTGDLPLEEERLFTPARVEQYAAVGMKGLSPRSRSTTRGALRRIGRAATSRAPWTAEAHVYRGHVLAPPYTPEEIVGYWEAAGTQATERRSRVLTTVLTLGLGAGLRSREMVWVTPSALGRHDGGLVTINLPDRVVPVRAALAPTLLDLIEDEPHRPVIGRVSAGARDPLERCRKGVELPARLPRLVVSRLRTTWAVDVLRSGLRLSEYLSIAGTTSAKTLEAMVPYIGVRDDEQVWHTAAGLG